MCVYVCVGGVKKEEEDEEGRSASEKDEYI